MNLSRRMFLGGSIAIIGVSILPHAPSVVPTIWGDNIHDDWTGIDALWNCKPVNILADCVRTAQDGTIEMLGGTFLLSRSLYVPKNGPRIIGTGSIFKWTKPVTCLIFEGACGIVFT